MFVKTLREVSALFTRGLAPTPLVALLLRTIAEAVGGTVAVHLKGSDGAFRRASGSDPTDAGGSVDSAAIPPGVLDLLMTSREPVLLEAAEPGESADAGSVDRSDSVGALMLPLLSADQVIGVITVRPPASGEPFTPQDVDLLGALANQAATAIVNSQLREQVAAQRREAERLASVQELAARIAHEIKNPLIAIETFVQLLPSRRRDDQFRDNFGRIASREIGRVKHLVERLQSLATLGGRPWTTVDLRTPITEALELLDARFEHGRIALDWTPGPAPRRVHGDRAELEQLFLNLFLNALEAMSPGGRLTVRLAGDAGGATVEVEDIGSGIPDEILARIFDPLVTGKQHGSGLGLAIGAAIVRAHGGTILATNKSAGAGAMFSVHFPEESGHRVPRKGLECE